MDIRLTYNRNSFFIQQGICGTGHDSKLTLQLVPALDCPCLTSVFCDQIFHGNLQSSYIFQFFILDLNNHIAAAVVNYFCNLCSLFFYFFHFICKLGHGNRRKLDIEFFQKFSLIAHGCPEIKRSCGNLKDPHIFEFLYHIAYSHKIPDPAFKYRIIQAAVCHVGKRNTEASQNLSGSKKSALCITKPHSVFIRTLVKRPPQKNRNIQLLCQTGTFIFCTKITVGKKQSVNFFSLKLFSNFFHICIIIEKTFLINICDIYKINAQFSQTVSSKSPIFNRIRRAENTSSCRRVS